MQLNNTAQSIGRFRVNRSAPKAQDQQPQLKRRESNLGTSHQSITVQDAPRVSNWNAGTLQLQNMHLLNTISREQKLTNPSRQQGQGYGKKNPNSHSWKWVKIARGYYQRPSGHVRDELSGQDLNSMGLNRSEISSLLTIG